MVQFSVLSGKMAGTVVEARHFPFRLGRGDRMDARFEDSGVWDFHLELRCDPRRGFFLKRQPDALATVNGAAFEDQRLRNGDVVELGAARLRFSLSPNRQKRMGWRAALVWLLFLTVVAAEFTAIYWLEGWTSPLPVHNIMVDIFKLFV